MDIAADRKSAIAIVSQYRGISQLVRSAPTDLGFHAMAEIDDPSPAPDKLKQKNYRLVVSEWDVSPVSGLTLLKQLRADRRRRSTRFVVYAGHCHA